MIDFSKIKYYCRTPMNERPEVIESDVCVYGGSAAGVAAALQARRMGLQVIIVEFGSHLGGMSASGLGYTDIGNKLIIGGIAREFYQTIGKRYGNEVQHEEDGSVWKFEPHVAEQVFMDMVAEAGIFVYYEQHLSSVLMQGNRIKQMIMENGNIYQADVFIDATYEGDLMASSGVSYYVGREANSIYRETLNGVHFGHPNHNFKAWVDPYISEGKPDSGLIIGVSDAEPGFQGEGDSCIQAFNFRICLTKDPEKRIAFPEPPGYRSDRYTLLARYMQAGVWDAMHLLKMMPGGKTDLNNWGAFSTDNIGMNHEWPEGNYITREKIYQDHVSYNLGMLYFLSNDESVPLHIRQEVSQWGLPNDEFTVSSHWPHHLYVREARRMISDVVITENHCRLYKVEEDPVALAAYTMDSHHCRRLVLDGRCVNEGNVEVNPSAPYPISYRAIVPRGEECANLVVPVCLSASHIAFGSIRMEPVFMILGQSAGAIAALAMQSNCAVQELEYEVLRKRLLADKQVLNWRAAKAGESGMNPDVF